MARQSKSVDALPPLLPAQTQALAHLERAVATGHVAVLSGRNGVGKTVILRALHEKIGGTYLTSRDFVEASLERNPLALEETVYIVLAKAIREHDAVIVDDFHLISNIMCCDHTYPRRNYLAAALVPLANMARDKGTTLVIESNGMPLAGLAERAPMVSIAKYTVADFAAVLAHHLDASTVADFDVKKIFRFAPNLTARQLRNTCDRVRGLKGLDTDAFIEDLRKHNMISNVDLGEVQAVDLKDLKGLDDLLDALEAAVILPLENTAVAEELNLKPKRGVLLAGPPGTGKTSVGRALAHRLKSKFFLIDGTLIAGTPEFFGRLHQVFEAAKQNAPAIIFIDDSDVIFENSNDTGLYRYLLTMLDGLESASAGRVCLMMTAMNVANLPPALVRSGRIELWLETRLPDERAREAILADQCAALPQAMQPVDLNDIAKASDGLSGADLKRVVEDGKLLFAFERERRASMGSPTSYFLRAIETVLTNKSQYAQAEAAARVRHPRQRPPHFDAMGMMAQMAAMGGGNFSIETTGMMQSDGDDHVGNVGFAMLHVSDEG